MIPEVLEWCATSCPWFARQRGLLAAQIAIRHRAIRCRSAWKPHLDACRKFVSDSLGSASRDKSLIILGSGHLNDFDLPFLLQRFERITLVDAVHPLEIQLRARFSQGRLNLVTDDLSKPAKTTLGLVSESDWTVSSCLLSQLPLFAESTDSAAILSNHLQMLATAPRSILITDVAKRTVGKSAWTSLVEETHLPDPDAEWIWTIAPSGESGPLSEERLVQAFRSVHPGVGV